MLNIFLSPTPTAMLYQTLLALHICAGAIGLLLFWLPALHRKGGVQHRRYGRLYLRSMQTAGATAFALSLLLLLDPAAVKSLTRDIGGEALDAAVLSLRAQGLFLNLLAVQLLAGLNHAVEVLRAKDDRARLRRPAALAWQLGLLGYSIVAFAIGWHLKHALTLIFSGISLFTAASALHYSFKPRIGVKEWWIAHLSAVIATGIAAHTAVLVIGASRLIAPYFTDAWQIVPWIVPSCVGTTATLYLSAYYRRKFYSRSQTSDDPLVASP